MSPPSARPIILAVDDDPGIHEAFRLIFEDEYEVLSALDGPEAVEALTARPIDVGLLDIRMPGMTGLAVLEQARRLRPEARVIVVSCIDQSEPALAAMRLGAVEYVTKPFEADDLALIVRKALEVPPAASVTSTRPSIPRVLIISGDLGTRAGLAAALRTQCHVESEGTLSAATATLIRCNTGTPSKHPQEESRVMAVRRTWSTSRPHCAGGVPHALA